MTQSACTSVDIFWLETAISSHNQYMQRYVTFMYQYASFGLRINRVIIIKKTNCQAFTDIPFDFIHPCLCLYLPQRWVMPAA